MTSAGESIFLEFVSDKLLWFENNGVCPFSRARCQLTTGQHVHAGGVGVTQRLVASPTGLRRVVPLRGKRAVRLHRPGRG